MGILAWVVLGLLAGLVARLVLGDGIGVLGALVVGVVGALVGGFLSALIGFGSLSGIDLRSLVIATGGSVLVLAVHRRLSIG